MKLYNDMTRKKEEFVPLKEGEVKMYNCGPTVYNYIHVGNGRAFAVFDVLRRYLTYKGYKVTYVQNFTDVDDKIINRSIEEGISPKEVADKYIEEYFVDARGLGIKDADVHPRVSETIPEIIQFVQDLIDSGHAYQKGGDVYFDVSSFPNYGRLSGQSVYDLQSGARIEVNDVKDDPLDFALWKAKKEGEPYWDSPWGQGRPGWHIECSAMSAKYLGESIDIHSGGYDLIFPHHENEIAQSEARNGVPFARYWLHNGYINVDNVKMSKSLGNFFTVRDIGELYDLEAVRFFILSVQYRNPINFSKESISQSAAALDRLYNVKENLDFLISHSEDRPLSGEESEQLSAISAYVERFEEAMDDDLNTAEAIGQLFEMAKAVNVFARNTVSRKALEEARRLFMIPCGILGILEGRQAELLDSDIALLIEQREQARKDRDFARADEIRDLLKEKGITLEDTRDGVKWKRGV
ncbi:MAG: cysteine--tRNA ligase [Eubacteriaceae bacterium]|nr:cysteine--tRNA ligase [Eubacteriaceae bacterium]